MPPGLYFPSQQLVEVKHDLLIEKYGGLLGVRDKNPLGLPSPGLETCFSIKWGR